MAKCTKCGADLADGAKFCTVCGEKQPESASGQASQTGASASSSSNASIDFSETLKKFNDTEDTTAEFEQSDIDSNKVMGVLAYLSWLVLIPLLAASKSKFARFHTNQGLVLAIFEVIWGVAFAIISTILSAVFGLIHLLFIATVIITVLKLVNLAFFILAIIGIVNVVNGKAKQLPFIGRITLIK